MRLYIAMAWLALSRHACFLLLFPCPGGGTSVLGIVVARVMGCDSVTESTTVIAGCW